MASRFGQDLEGDSPGRTGARRWKRWRQRPSRVPTPRGSRSSDHDSFGCTRRRFERNAMNPRIGSGMQQARNSPRGENRRGGAKPRGRNENPSRQARIRNPTETSGGSGRVEVVSMEGRYGRRTRERTSRRIPREETGESRSARERSSGGEPEARGHDARVAPSVAERAEDLEGPPGNRQGRGGNGEGQRPVTPEPRRSSEPWKRGADLTALSAR
jgi:hypothetical protein